MSRYSNSLSALFRKWGKQQQQLPPNHEAIKAHVLGALRPANDVTIQKPRRFWKIIFSGAALAVGILVIVPMIIFRPTTSDNISDYEFDNLQYSASSGGVTGLSENVVGSLACSPDDPYCLNKAQPEKLGNSDPGIGQQFIVDLYNKFESDVQPSSIDDTREFLKTDYSITIKTRQVEKISTRVQTMVRGYGGRIDSVRVNKENGYITFVLPKSSLPSFSTELQDMVGPRFFTDDIQMRNMLSNKQAIEKEAASAGETLTVLEDDKKNLIDTHTKKVASLESQIKKYNASMYQLQQENATSTVRQEEIKKQIAYFGSKKISVTQLLNKENAQFEYALEAVNSNIETMKTRLLDLGVQDQALIKDVETVEGTVSLQWISIFAILNLYVPMYWIMSIGCIVIIIIYLAYGRRKGFDVI